MRTRPVNRPMFSYQIRITMTAPIRISGSGLTFGDSSWSYVSWSSGAFQFAMFHIGNTKLGPLARFSFRTRFESA